MQHAMFLEAPVAGLKQHGMTGGAATLAPAKIAATAANVADAPSTRTASLLICDLPST